MADLRPAGGNARNRNEFLKGFRHFKRALVDGAVILLPIGAIVLLTMGILHRLQDAANPLAGRFVHPLIVAIGLLIVLCVLIGFLVRSASGRWTQRLLEHWVFEKVPGYRLAKAFANEQLLDQGDGRTLRPALAAIEEGRCPVLVMDTFADGRMLVFVPGSPAPMSGALYIFTPDKITLIDIPLMPFVKAISSWGLGLKEMIEAAEAKSALPAPRTDTHEERV